MKVFDINLQNNQINRKLTFYDGKKGESTISCLGHRMGTEAQNIMAEPCPDLSWSQDQPQGWDPANMGSKVCASRSTMPPAQGRRKQTSMAAAGGEKCRNYRAGMRPE